MTRFIAYYLLSLFVFFAISGRAQSYTAPYDFIRGEKVIFEDHFRSDNIKAFPSRWQISVCTEQQYYNTKKSWTIEKEDGEIALRSGTTFMHISPAIKPKLFPKDSFTVEFDCTFEDAAACAELYFTLMVQSAACKEVCFHILSWGKISVNYPDEDAKYTASYPGDFDYKAWHHFAFSYCNKEIKCYLDGRTMLQIPDCGFSPVNLSLGCIAPVRFSHFIITRIDANSLNDILTKKKFVTHAIHFDNDRSVMKPESMGFITQMITFLQLHPEVNLEIDGHTDNVGDTKNNMELSIARADEVKKQLIEGGINESRLVAKGYGSSKPVRPNTTAENKAENRRVEFIRL